LAGAKGMKLSKNPNCGLVVVCMSFRLPLSHLVQKSFSEVSKYQNDDIQAFDYHYQVTTHDKNGSHTTHYRFSFFILQLPAFFPDLTIRHESFLLKVAEVFGYQDIKFESAEFSKAFNVRSPDKKFAYDVCNAKMMEYLLANRDLSIEIENQALALAFDTCLSAEQIEFNLQRLAQIRSLMPDYLFTQNA
jgi:hypothetical protein